MVSRSTIISLTQAAKKVKPKSQAKKTIETKKETKETPKKSKLE